MRIIALLAAFAVVAAAESEGVDPCKRQPFRGRCPSKNGESPKRSQFVLRYYMRNGECVSYPYGHCASDDTEPQLYRYKEECEDACINPPPANLGSPKEDMDQTYGTVGELPTEAKESTTTQASSTSTETTTTTQVPLETTALDTTVTSSTTATTPTTTSEELILRSRSEAPSTESSSFTSESDTLVPGIAARAFGAKSPPRQPHKPLRPRARPLDVAPAPEQLRHDQRPQLFRLRARRPRRDQRLVLLGQNARDVVPPLPLQRFVEDSFHLAPPQGAFQKLQCEPDGRQCFCVDSKGIEIPNSRTRNGQKPDCDEIQPQQTPKTKECVGNAVRGPCTASQSRWYYDEQEAKCKRFTYSGCGGNGNNYETEAACTHRCAPPPMGLPKCEKGEPLKTKLGVTVNCAKSDCPYGYKCSVVQQSSVCCPENNKIIGLQTSPPNDVCSMPKERGPCDKYELRFYYNAELKECKYFFWGGCEGNGNNFEKVEECESTCGIAKAKDDLPTTSRPSAASSARPLSFRTTQGIRISLGNQTKSEESSPSVQQSQSPTTATSNSPMVTQPRRVMVQEPTTSVDSSSPSEASTPSEARHSQATPSMTMHVAQTRAPSVPQMALLEVNRCLHPRDPGNCRGQFIRWYWDNERKICDVFTYTGCQGNGNNYASREECLAICHKEATPVVSNDFSNVCKNDVDAGECNGVFQRFAFDTESGECRPFTYGGCGGNGNNFATLAECRIKCQKVALSPGNLCEHDIEVGECSGVFVRFGYDKSNNDCRQFTYGGCGGNGNNFATIQECRNVCVKKVCNPNPQCDLTRCQIVNNRNGCPFCSCPPTNQPLPPGPGSSQCPEIDADKCKEPCIVINNRKGCKDCVCPSLPGADASPPASFDNTVAAPSPPAHSTTKAPRPVQDHVRPPATPVNVGPPSGPPARGSAPGTSDDRIINRQESVITAQSSQRKQIEIDAKQLLPPPLSAHLQEKCMQPVEPGPCKHFVDRWFFNSEDGTCHPFKYGGCAGNRNHFFSQNECEIHCARFLHRVNVPSTPLHVHENPDAALEPEHHLNGERQRPQESSFQDASLFRETPPSHSSSFSKSHSVSSESEVVPSTSGGPTPVNRPRPAGKLPFDLPASVRAHAIPNFVPHSSKGPYLSSTTFYPETYEAWDVESVRRIANGESGNAASRTRSEHRSVQSASSGTEPRVQSTDEVASAHLTQQHRASSRPVFKGATRVEQTQPIPLQLSNQGEQSQVKNEQSQELRNERVQHRSEHHKSSAANSNAHQERSGNSPVEIQRLKTREPSNVELTPFAPQARKEDAQYHSEDSSPSKGRIPSDRVSSTLEGDRLASNIIPRVHHIPIRPLEPLQERTHLKTVEYGRDGRGRGNVLPNLISASLTEDGRTEPPVFDSIDMVRPPRLHSVATYPRGYGSNTIGSYNPQQNNNLAGLSPPVDPTYFTYNSQHLGVKKQFAVNSIPFERQMPPDVSRQLQFSRQQQEARALGPQTFATLGAQQPMMNVHDSHTQMGSQSFFNGPSQRNHQTSQDAAPVQHQRSPQATLHEFESANRRPVSSVHQQNLNDARRTGNEGQAGSSFVPTHNHLSNPTVARPQFAPQADVQLNSAPSQGTDSFNNRGTVIADERPLHTSSHGRGGIPQHRSNRPTAEVEQSVDSSSLTRQPISADTFSEPKFDREKSRGAERQSKSSGTARDSQKQDWNRFDGRESKSRDGFEQRTNENASTDLRSSSRGQTQHSSSSGAPLEANHLDHRTTERRLIYSGDGAQTTSIYPRRTIENNRVVVTSQQNSPSAVEGEIMETKKEWRRVVIKEGNEAKSSSTQLPRSPVPRQQQGDGEEFPANIDRSKFLFYNGDYYAPTIPGVRVARPDLEGPGSDIHLSPIEGPPLEMLREFQRKSQVFRNVAPLMKDGAVSKSKDKPASIMDKAFYMQSEGSVANAPPVRLPDKRTRKLQELSERISDNDFPEFLRAPPPNSTRTRPISTLNQVNIIQDLPYDNFPSIMQSINNSLTKNHNYQALHERANSHTKHKSVQPNSSITGIVSDDDDENNDDLEAIPRRAAGVSQIPLREPIGLGKSSAPHLRGSAPSHAAHGKKLAAIPAIHMDTMMSTASVEVSDEEDEEISQPNLHAAMADAPQTIAGQRVSRITLPTTSSTQAHHTKSSSTRRSTTTTTTTTTTEASEASTTTSTAPPSTTGVPSSDSPTSESTTPDSATQQALSTTETVSADQSTPSQSTPTVEESSSSTPVSSTTEASSTQGNDEPSELGFFETTSHPETTDSEEDLIESSNATETTSSSSAVESSSNSTTISYSSSTDASASLSTTSPASDTEESPSTIDLSVIISSTPSLVSTTGFSDSATSDTLSTEASTITTTESTTLHDETLTVEAKTIEVSTPPTGASDDDLENSISSTTERVSADIDNSITTTKSAASSTTSQKPGGAVLKTPLEINANTVQLSSKFKSDPEPSNEPVEFFDPNDLPPPPPENERRPVLNAAPQFSSQSVKPLKKIEILPIPVKDADPPKAVITETLPKSVVTAAQVNIPIETTVGYDFTTESTTPKKPLSDLGESNDPSSLEVSSSEEVEGYPIGREPVPLSPVGIGRNMERLDIEGLEVPTTVVPLVRTSTTDPEDDEDASDFAEIQQSIDTQSVTRRATQTPSTEGSAAPTTRAAATAAPEAEYPTTEIRSTQASTTPVPSTQAATTQEATTAEPPSTQAATTRQSTTTTEESTTTTVAATTPSTTSPRPTTVSSTPPPTTRPPVTTRSPVTTPPPVTSTVGTRPPAPRTAAPLAVPRGQSELDARVICALPPDAGTCFEYSPRWFFNAQSSQCEQFSYGSCGGNENNFLDRTSCEVKCMASHTAVLSRVPERCTYERDAGTGKGYNVKWYFNMKNLRCEQFVFEGQGGNENQFETLSDCERLCAPEPASARRTASPPLPAVVQQPAPPAPRERPTIPVVASVPDHVDQTIQDIIDYDEKLSQFAENARAIPPSSPIQNSVDSRVPVAPTATRAPLPPAPHLEQPSPGFQPRSPAAQAAKTVVHQEKAQEVTTTTTAKPVVQERRKEIYKAEPLPERPPSTGNEGLPIVGASPPMSVNYQTGEVKNKASGIRTFHESSLRVAVEDSDLTEGSERRRDSLSCPNGIQEIRYADGRPVMCLPGKNQCPDKSVCYFNGMDFFCCPNEEDPYDKHVFGGYDGEETKHGYKVFGPLNIRRLMDDVPLRVRRNVRSARIRRQSMPETVANAGFNLDSITGPLRFDDEKPRQVSRAQRMRVKPPPPNHGNPICIEPLSQGDCGAAHLRYFYDRDADKCRLFYYTGCKGNNNNFGSLLDCQRLCVLGGQRPSSESATSAPKQIIRGQCPNDKMPLGGSAPVLCGNTTDSIGCPAGFYCLPGPPDVCCPKNAQGDDDEKSSVRFAPEIKSLTRENPRKAHLSTPKFMCPDASDPLMGSAGEPTPCGAGFDGMKLCPKGFYCAIDVEKQTRMCCPLYGAGERVPTEQVIAPYLGRRPSNPGEILERGSLPSDQALFTASAPETTTSMFEEDSQEFDGEEEEEEGEEGMAHLMLKPADPPQESSTELSTDAPESEHEHAIDLPTEPSPVEEAPVLKEAEDKSICQIRPSEGRACREDEQPPRTNLHYFYSPKDHRCKLYFYRGCGGNANRFEKKADCERLCLN
ncbi:hypothetical protein Q1695_003474 [Nippostrongylus brasiliensis]|nr:hypothetical protein Q1695_003474 [Nippostrongylus brasiliensis]